MKQHWVEYHEHWPESPMSVWVHKPVDGRPWPEARLEPPAPAPIPGRGFAVFHVEVDGFVFTFSSFAELDACVTVLSKNPLPTSRQLSAEHGIGAGPNQHWLSRLPAGTKSWKYRQKAVTYLQKARSAFEEELAG